MPAGDDAACSFQSFHRDGTRAHRHVLRVPKSLSDIMRIALSHIDAKTQPPRPRGLPRARRKRSAFTLIELPAVRKRGHGFTLIELPAVRKRGNRAFTLIELLVVIAIIAMLTSILLPSLTRAKDLARAASCQSQLHNLGIAGAMYQSQNDGFYWPYMLNNHPQPGQRCYFWGAPGDPVDHSASPLLEYCDENTANFDCPSLKWGSYIPQAGVNEPTTTYGYNAWCLDPIIWGRKDERGKYLPRKKADDIKNGSELFVFADSGLYWSAGGISIFQNSTSLDPVTLGAWGVNHTPTTHFRHNGRTNALCADGHAESFTPEGGEMIYPEQQLGFVGTENAPHYDQE